MGAPDPREAGAGGDAPEQHGSADGTPARRASDSGGEGLDYAWLQEQLVALGADLGSVTVRDEWEDEVRRGGAAAGSGGRHSAACCSAHLAFRQANSFACLKAAAQSVAASQQHCTSKHDLSPPPTPPPAHPQFEEWRDPSEGLLTSVFDACERNRPEQLSPLLQRLAGSQWDVNTPGPDGDTAL